MNNKFPQAGRVAGIDFGTVRIGIAICDQGQCFASPVENYQRRDPEGDARRFQQLVENEEEASCHHGKISIGYSQLITAR